MEDEGELVVVKTEEDEIEVEEGQGQIYEEEEQEIDYNSFFVKAEEDEEAEDDDWRERLLANYVKKTKWGLRGPAETLLLKKANWASSSEEEELQRKLLRFEVRLYFGLAVKEVVEEGVEIHYGPRIPDIVRRAEWTRLILPERREEDAEEENVIRSIAFMRKELRGKRVGRRGAANGNNNDIHNWIAREVAGEDEDDDADSDSDCSASSSSSEEEESDPLGPQSTPTTTTVTTEDSADFLGFIKATQQIRDKLAAYRSKILGARERWVRDHAPSQAELLKRDQLHESLFKTLKEAILDEKQPLIEKLRDRLELERIALSGEGEGTREERIRGEIQAFQQNVITLTLKKNKTKGKRNRRKIVQFQFSSEPPPPSPPRPILQPRKKCYPAASGAGALEEKSVGKRRLRVARGDSSSEEEWRADDHENTSGSSSDTGESSGSDQGRRGRWRRKQPINKRKVQPPPPRRTIQNKRQRKEDSTIVSPQFSKALEGGRRIDDEEDSSGDVMEITESAAFASTPAPVTSSKSTNPKNKTQAPDPPLPPIIRRSLPPPSSSSSGSISDLQFFRVGDGGYGGPSSCQEFLRCNQHYIYRRLFSRSAQATPDAATYYACERTNCKCLLVVFKGSGSFKRVGPHYGNHPHPDPGCTVYVRIDSQQGNLYFPVPPRFPPLSTTLIVQQAPPTQQHQMQQSCFKFTARKRTSGITKTPTPNTSPPECDDDDDVEILGEGPSDATAVGKKGNPITITIDDAPPPPPPPPISPPVQRVGILRKKIQLNQTMKRNLR